VPFGLPANIPHWVYLVALLLGVPLTGVGSSWVGASQANAESQRSVMAESARQADQLSRLEKKVDDLDDSFNDLEKALIRLNPGIQLP